jgi:hypothetical protein
VKVKSPSVKGYACNVAPVCRDGSAAIGIYVQIPVSQAGDPLSELIWGFLPL